MYSPRMIRLSAARYSHRSALLMTTALQASMLLASSQPADAQPAPNARPSGGTVVAGTAAISQTVAATTISQSSQRAAINWNSFNVGSQQTVTFQQPSASAFTLNRVTGPDPSQIAGRIDANGNVVLVNQSGVTFYKGSQVNTAGLMVSAAGISNQNFMAGRMVFDQPAQPNARVENQGTITIKQAGLAALVAPQVANSGVITANLGHVVLAGAKTATLDLYGDGLLSINVTNQVTQTPSGATALVTNTGVITANGGTVQLTARAADGVIQNLVRAGGKISTATVGAQTGSVVLNGVGGSIVVQGQLSAPGTAPGTMGGAVEVLSNGNVTLAHTAKIDVSGQTGGGVVAIGTNLRRARVGPSATHVPLAHNAVVEKGATIDASAITNGDGGRVAVLSANTTEMNGSIAARGGAQGGNGGFVETSGTNLSVTGSVDLSAPHGSLGTWMLDPTFLDVINGPPPTGTEDGGFAFTDTVLASDGKAATPDTVSNGIINSATADVVLQATQTLTVGANINLPLAGQTLTLEAGGTLTINSGVAVTAPGNVILATGGAGPVLPAPPAAQPSPLISVLGAVSSTTGSVSLLSGAGGTISIGPGGSVTPAPGGIVNLTSGTGGIALTGNAALGPAGLLDIISSGPVSQAASSVITATEIESTGGVNGNVALLGTNNAITVIGDFAVGAGSLVAVSGTNLTLAGTQTGGTLFFEVAYAGGTLTLGTQTLVTAEVPGVPAVLAAANGRITLVADNYVVANPASSLTATGGTVELAPFSAINTSLLGSSGLVVGPPLLSIIQTGGGTLAVGSFTDATAGATTPTVSASSITIDAPLDVGPVASTLRLDATGAVTQPGGALTVTNLTGSGGTWTLTNAGNAVATLGSVTAPIFALTDSTDLAVTGLLTAATSAAITDAGALTIPSAINAGAVGLTANSIGISGSVIGSTVNLSATTGSLSETGTLIAGILTGSAATTASLTGTNQISELGNFSAGSFVLNDGVNLTVTGLLAAATSAVINDAGALTIPGAINTGAAGLTANSIDIPGSVSGSTVNLSATTGSLSETGTLIAGTLTGGAATTASLTGTNQIAGLGNFSAGSFVLNDGVNLTVTGLLAAATSAIINDAGALTIPGAINTGAAGLTANSIGIPGSVIGSTVNLSATTGALSETGTLIAGILTGSAATTASLTGTNQISELGNFSAGSFALTDGVNLTVTGLLAAATSAVINDAGALTIAGAINTGAAGLTANSIGIPGSVSGSTVNLSATTGALSETGTLIAGTLTGGAATTASLTGTNQIANLGNFSAGSLALNDAADLLIGGTVTAPNIAISAPANQVSLGDGAAIVTGGSVRPPGAIQPALEPVNGGPGAYIQAAGFTQIGSSTLAGQGGGPATLQIAVTGNMQFDPPLDLQAANGWLILNLTNGTAAGTMFVNALDVWSTVPGGTNLLGTIGGITGGAAASAGFIQPAINGNYLFNGCEIEAATCHPLVVTTPPIVPVLPEDAQTSVLGGLYPFLQSGPPPLIGLPNIVVLAVPLLPAPPRRLTNPDVVPPNISYVDY